MTSFNTHLCFLGAALFVYMVAWFIVAARKKRADLADVAWGLGFAFVSWISYAIGNHQIVGLIVTILVTIAGCRLSLHIYERNKHREEDFRYQEMKKGWKRKSDLFFRVFLLQGIILFIVALPIFWIHTHNELPVYNPFLLLWLFGFVIECISDHQLAAFKKDPENKGKLLKTGMWSTSRHPNYFGEILQWWAIWAVSGEIWLVFSPILITFLIIKVSGIAPLEKKLQARPDFQEYAKQTPSLVPTTFINGAIYTLAWFSLIYSGAKGSFFIPLIVFISSFGAQIVLFFKRDVKSLLVLIPITLYSTILGMTQEMIFIHFDLLKYPNDSILPPFWLVCLYPLFALTINSSLSMLNRNLLATFLIGAVGAMASYLTGEKLGGVQLLAPLYISLSWGIFLTLLILLNRKLISIRDEYTNPQTPITVFFDVQCPVCSREMETLKKRKQTGLIDYACPLSDQDLQKYTKDFNYSQSMKVIHAIDSKGKISKGIDALAAVYARTDLSFISILLEAPGLTILFRAIYAIWARFRPSKANNR